MHARINVLFALFNPLQSLRQCGNHQLQVRYRCTVSRYIRATSYVRKRHDAKLFFAGERKLGLKQVLECTKQVVQWNLLRIQLGIDPTVIRMIQHQHPHSVEQCKMEMFSRWLLSEENPTWEKLVEALENRSYGTVAREIRDKIGLQGASYRA